MKWRRTGLSFVGHLEADLVLQTNTDTRSTVCLSNSNNPSQQWGVFDQHSVVHVHSEAFISLTTTKLTSHCLAYFMDRFELFSDKIILDWTESILFQLQWCKKTRFIQVSIVITPETSNIINYLLDILKKRINRSGLKFLEKGLSDYRKGRSSIETVFSL
jgi:hypothetical protein